VIPCVQCIARFARDEVDVSELPARCPHCDGVLRRDTVSFGEPIPPDVLEPCYVVRQLRSGHTDRLHLVAVRVAHEHVGRLAVAHLGTLRALRRHERRATPRGMRQRVKP
jgi:hypothetical protein